MTVRLLFVLAAGLALAQDQPEITGTVREPGPDGRPVGVPGVEMILSEFVTVDIAALTKQVTRKEYARTFTDGAGAFRFRPERFGEYYLEAVKDGYQRVGPGGPPTKVAAESPVSITRQQPRPALQYQITRPGEISGRLIDDDGKPLVGLTVVVLPSGTPIRISATTAEDGSFSAPRLAPGDYLVRVLPEGRDSERIEPYTQPAFEVVEEDLEAAYLPGGDDPTTARPVTIRSGTFINLGTMRVRKVPYYRVHVSVTPEMCPGGKSPRLIVRRDSLTLAVELTANLPRNPPAIRCEPDLLVTNLRPGRYWFALSTGTDGFAGHWALTSVDIASRNVEAAMTMMATVDVPGRVVTAKESAAPRLEGMRIMLATEVRGLPGNGASKVDPDGTFLLPQMAWSRRLVVVEPLQGRNATHYVESIRYGGVETRDGVITLVPGASLEVIVADKPASLTGVVANGSQPASGAYVVLLKWPLTAADPRRSARTDEQGIFQITGLPPGEYRVLAVPMSSAVAISKPDVMNQLMGSAERVTLKRGGSRSVTLKLVDPGR